MPVKSGDKQVTNDHNRSVANNLPKQPGQGDAFSQPADNRPEALVQRKMQEAIHNSPRVKQLRAYQQMANSARPVQMKPLPVEIKWGVTHLVKKMNDSLFGGEDFQEGEIGQEGELTIGQRITINDEKTFLSRRGSNQEDPKRRFKDQQSAPSVLWYHVLTVNGKDVSGEKLYVRENTFAGASEVEEKLSAQDEQQLLACVSDALGAASSVPGPWLDLMRTSNTDMSASYAMIKKMYALFALGDILKARYHTLDIAVRLNLKPQNGIKLIAPPIAQLVRKGIGITVNALESGGNYTGWTSLDHLQNYLHASFETFTSVFSSIDSAQGQFRLLKTLTSSDVNIEKFITLMQAVVVEALISGSGQQGELESEMAGHATISGGNGRGLISVAFDYLSVKYLKSKYSQQQIEGLDYEETPQQLREWLTTNGYTVLVIRDAIRNSARDKSVPIETGEVESLWNAVVSRFS